MLTLNDRLTFTDSAVVSFTVPETASAPELDPGSTAAP